MTLILQLALVALILVSFDLIQKVCSYFLRKGMRQDNQQLLGLLISFFPFFRASPSDPEDKEKDFLELSLPSPPLLLPIPSEEVDGWGREARGISYLGQLRGSSRSSKGERGRTRALPFLFSKEKEGEEEGREEQRGHSFSPSPLVSSPSREERGATSYPFFFKNRGALKIQIGTPALKERQGVFFQKPLGPKEQKPD